MRRFLIACGVAAASAATATAALAQDAGELGYAGDGGNVQRELGGGPVAEVGVGTLPFTGLDLAFLIAAGVVLLATGLLVRRFGRSGA